MSLAEKVLKGNLRAAARLMRLVDDDFEATIDEMKEIYPHTGKARIIGITGNPGAGKSSLVDKIIMRYRADGKKVGVVAIDPTSPFTGGAIMGDRVRMGRHFEDEEVFIRSLATRGHLGGLSKSTGEIIRIMEAWGADPVIIETVGVGQAEVDVVKMAQTSIVVMAPGLGDDIQAIKAGIMEIADIFVINKADRDGADKTMRDVGMMLEMVHPEDKSDWLPKVLKTVAFKDEGIDELVDTMKAHYKWLRESNKMASKMRQRIELQFFDLLFDRLTQNVHDRLDSKSYKDWGDKLGKRTLDPYTLAENLEKDLFNS